MNNDECGSKAAMNVTRYRRFENVSSYPDEIRTAGNACEFAVADVPMASDYRRHTVSQLHIKGSLSPVLVRRLESAHDGIKQCGIGEILAEVPRHDTAQIVAADVRHLKFNGSDVVVGPVVRTVIQIRRLGY
jgi:hypothetical protein